MTRKYEMYIQKTVIDKYTSDVRGFYGRAESAEKT